ncbi:hypothetical protein GCM10027055_26660 [Janibacter alkaliphilus]
MLGEGERGAVVGRTQQALQHLVRDPPRAGLDLRQARLPHAGPLGELRLCQPSVEPGATDELSGSVQGEATHLRTIATCYTRQAASHDPVGTGAVSDAACAATGSTTEIGTA